MSALVNYLLEATSAPFCLFWVLRDVADTVVGIFGIFFLSDLTSTWHGRPKHTHKVFAVNLMLTKKKKRTGKKKKKKHDILLSAHFQSHWVMKPVCDILKWASYFIIDWQLVTILTESLTFCWTCRPKSCFWPFCLFTLFDSVSHAVNI